VLVPGSASAVAFLVLFVALGFVLGAYSVALFVPGCFLAVLAVAVCVLAPYLFSLLSLCASWRSVSFAPWLSVSLSLFLLLLSAAVCCPGFLFLPVCPVCARLRWLLLLCASDVRRCSGCPPSPLSRAVCYRIQSLVASLLSILCGSKHSYPQDSAESRMALGLEC